MDQLYNHKTLLLLIVLSVVLIFPRLGENVLQVDEGADTFYSLTILKYGYPATSDGINEFGHTHAINGVWKQQPWFPFYVRALSLYVFGQNSFAARFPSALFGVLSVPLLYFLSLKVLESKKEAAVAAVLFTCSVPLLLYFRTARYIAFQMPLTLLIIWFYIQILEHKKWSAVGFVISSVLLFHSMYVQCAGVLLGIVFYLLVFERTRDKVKQFVPLFITIFFFTAPWILYIYPVFERVSSDYIFRTGGMAYDLSLFALIKRFGAFVFQINNYIFPLILLFFVPIEFCKKDYLLKHKELVLLVIVIFTTIGVSTLNFIPLQQYIAGVLPLFYIFTARIICMLRPTQKPAIMTIIAGLLIFSNVVHVGPLYAFKGIDYLSRNRITESLKNIEYFRSPVSTFNWQVQLKSVFLQYLYEITHQYRGPLDGIVKYVKKHETENDTFFMNHEKVSFAFHTNMRQINKIPLPEPPAWIILRKNSPIGSALKQTVNNRTEIKKKENFYKKYIFDYIKHNGYQKIALDYPAQYGNNVFEVQIHHFKTPETDSNVVIYQHKPRSDTKVR